MTRNFFTLPTTAIRRSLFATASVIISLMVLQSIGSGTFASKAIAQEEPEKQAPQEPEKDKPEQDKPAPEDPDEDDPEQKKPKQEKPDEPDNPPPGQPEDPIAKPDTDDEEKADDAKKEANDKPKAAKGDTRKKRTKKVRTIEDVTKDHYFKEGLFKVYRDPKSGVIRLEVREDQLDREFIYFSHITDGVIEGGHFRGQYRRAKVLKIRKYFERLELVEVNRNFYFDPESPLARAETANISESVLATSKIEAKSPANEDIKKYLIRADLMFLSEDLDRLSTPRLPGVKPGMQFRLGKVNRAKSRVLDVDTYPENITVQVDYVFSNPAAPPLGGAEITDPRNVSVQVQHLLMEMPDTDYKPRFDDPRVGYFLEYQNDMTSTGPTPWHDMIQRWDLRKKNPELDISDPMEPIVWWIENTTPTAIRPTIEKAALAWNKAFESAGFQNVIEVKTQPDDAEWSADDIRYNVLRWTSSPTPLFGGYGPRFSNPRTGQILGADIMLEFVFLTNRVRAGSVYNSTAFSVDGTPLHTEHREATLAQLSEHEKSCGLAQHLHLNNLVGRALAASNGLDAAATDRLIEESIYYLVLHELGHTFGLSHNMKSSYALRYEDAHDQEAQGDALIGSVMDYPAINFAPANKTQSRYYTLAPGPYDEWALRFGYAPEMDDPDIREAHLARSTEKALAFGNDADDMRAPGKGIDPRINIGDFTDDPVQYAEDRLELDRKTVSGLVTKFSKPGQSYQEMRNAYGILLGDIANQGHILSRYIGGIYVDRSVHGQTGADVPYRPVDLSRQKQAMKLLRTHIFAPDAFATDPNLLRHVSIQRRGFAHFFMTEDPKLHGVINNIQMGILHHILHPATLMRLTDTSLYGNSYSVNAMMADLTDAIFEDDARGKVNSIRQELQILYIHRLAGILKAPVGYDFVARSGALSNLKNIRKSMARWRGDADTRAHREHISYLIDQALDDKAR